MATTQQKLDPSVAQARALAQEARARRAAAPMTAVGMHGGIDQDNQMARAAEVFKSKGLPVPHMQFVPKDDMKKWARDGYEPILEDVDSGDTFEVSTDILVGCEEEQFQQHLRTVSKKSERMLAEEADKAKNSAAAGEQSITVAKGNPDGSGVTPGSERDVLDAA